MPSTHVDLIGEFFWFRVGYFDMATRQVVPDEYGREWVRVYVTIHDNWARTGG